MATRQDNRFLKIIFGVVILLFILLAYWSYTTYQENENIKSNLTTEKERIEEELKNISIEYTSEIEKGNMLSNDLIDARERIIKLRDSVINLEGSVAVMSILRKELSKIKNERVELTAKISKLEESNKYLVRINDSTLAALNVEIIKSELKEETVTKLTENVKLAATLIPTNFKMDGVIVRRSGKQIINDRASRVDDLKVCFTLPENALANKGVSTFYLQVINPENNVMGLAQTVSFESKTLTYSKIVEFNYEGKELNICELLGADVEMITKGTYRVNLFNGPIRVGNSEVVFR
jgi:cell division protein FtsB